MQSFLAVLDHGVHDEELVGHSASLSKPKLSFIQDFVGISPPY